jgi:hypothetical protein
VHRSNSSHCIFGHENCANIVSIHNNRQNQFNMQIFQQMIYEFDFFCDLRDGKFEASLSLGTPTNRYVKQIYNEFSDSNSCFWVSCLITVTENFKISVHFIFDFRFNFQSKIFCVDYKLNDMQHLMISTLCWSIHTKQLST